MAQHHAIAVVGSGPRGTSVVERICASAPELLPTGHRLTVHVIDPAPPGAGQVWRTDQPGELLMNTVASQVTLFTDDSVDAEGPLRPGPSLHAWYSRLSPSGPGPDDYPSRALYGRYLRWFFGEVRRTAPPAVTVRAHAARAVRLSTGGDGTETLDLSGGARISGLDAVVLAQGHLPSAPDAVQRRLTAHARRHGLRYFPPANPADLVDGLCTLRPGEPVLLRGLGLNFFDHLTLLTSGRGGRFVPAGPGLRYLPSGREPRLYAGSRRGLPHLARGDNEKGAHGRHLPLVLTPAVIAGFRQRAADGDPADFRRGVWPLVAKEVETVYYTALLGPACRQPFLRTSHGSAEEAAVLEKFGLPPDRRWDWEAVTRPALSAAPHGFAGPAAYREWLLGALRDDIAHARLGNVHGPRKAALDALRDLRNEVRQIVDHGGLRGSSRRDHLDGWYTPLNAYLSIGPPRRRVEEMVALIEAGVLGVVGPGMEVRAADGGFEARSPAVPDGQVTATALIEARLPEPDLRRSTDPLLRGLLAAGACRPHLSDGYQTGGLDVTERPYRLLDAGGRAHPRRLAVGVPTEGVHWVTAAGARPGVNSVTLADTDAVARAALRTTARPLAVVPPQASREPTGVA